MASQELPPVLPSPSGAHDGQARVIQQAYALHRVRRAANLLKKLPLDLKELTVEWCRVLPDAKAFSLPLDISMERIICERLKLVNNFDSGEAVQVDALCGTFDLATLHFDELSIDSTREFLWVSEDFELRVARGQVAPEPNLQDAMRGFARRVIDRADSGNQFISSLTHPNRVLEVAILCTGA
jgi:hypothetical protein